MNNAYKPKLTNLRTTQQLGLKGINRPEAPTEEELQTNEALLKDLHTLLLETEIMEGKLVCGSCGFEYAVKEGIANFLLPNHLV